jgi:hypothetical protein
VHHYTFRAARLLLPTKFFYPVEEHHGIDYDDNDDEIGTLAVIVARSFRIP